VVALPLRLARTAAFSVDETIIVCALALMAALAMVGVGLYLRALNDRRVRGLARARREQRLHLARDLHDFVAHEVTAIVLEAQAGQVKAHKPMDARAAFGRIEQAGLQALSSIDHALHTLQDSDERSHGPRPPQLHGLADLPDLLDRYSGDGMINTDLHIEPGLTLALPRQADSTAYRVVVEALTNVRRHAAGATQVDVHVASADGPAVRVSVTDNGGQASRDAGHRHGGIGLIGLAERVEALGGTFIAGPTPAGWHVTITLPVAGATRFQDTRWSR
jgi:signal transduction histidine kinase